MSDWGFIGLAYGLTHVVLAGYFIHLLRRLARARSNFARLQRNEGEP